MNRFSTPGDLIGLFKDLLRLRNVNVPGIIGNCIKFSLLVDESKVDFESNAGDLTGLLSDLLRGLKY